MKDIEKLVTEDELIDYVSNFLAVVAEEYENIEEDKRNLSESYRDIFISEQLYEDITDEQISEIEMFLDTVITADLVEEIKKTEIKKDDKADKENIDPIDGKKEVDESNPDETINASKKDCDEEMSRGERLIKNREKAKEYARMPSSEKKKIALKKAVLNRKKGNRDYLNSKTAAQAKKSNKTRRKMGTASNEDIQEGNEMNINTFNLIQRLIENVEDFEVLKNLFEETSENLSETVEDFENFDEEILKSVYENKHYQKISNILSETTLNKDENNTHNFTSSVLQEKVKELAETRTKAINETINAKFSEFNINSFGILDESQSNELKTMFIDTIQENVKSVEIAIVEGLIEDVHSYINEEVLPAVDEYAEYVENEVSESIKEKLYEDVQEYLLYAAEEIASEMNENKLIVKSKTSEQQEMFIEEMLSLIQDKLKIIPEQEDMVEALQSQVSNLEKAVQENHIDKYKLQAKLFEAQAKEYFSNKKIGTNLSLNSIEKINEEFNKSFEDYNPTNYKEKIDELFKPIAENKHINEDKPEPKEDKEFKDFNRPNSAILDALKMGIKQ